MSVSQNQVAVNGGTYLFVLANASTINAGNINTNSISTNTINAAVGNISSLNVQNVSTTYLEASTIYATEGTIDFLSTYTIELDGNYLTTDRVGGGGELLLNGFPIATTNNISSIGDWALYEAISTVKMNGNNLSNANGLYASNASLTNSVTAPMGSIRIFNSSNITNSNDIMTNTLETTGGVTIGGTLLVNNITNSNAINTISLGARSGTFSTLSVSSLNVSSIVTPINPNLVLSSLTVQTLSGNSGSFSTLAVSSLTVSSIVTPPNPNLTLSSLTTQTLSVTNSATFANGGTFNGTRPNFTTGINTNGPNNFNYQSLDNIRQVTGSNIDMFAIDPSGTGGESMTIGADGGTYTAFYPTTNIISRYGGGGQINITAERPSLLVGVPSQNVNITAKGGVGYYTGVPVGGGINLSAEAGGINLTTTTGVLANGAIKQTAYTFFNGIYTVPGFAARSAGCSAEYSGLTSPTLPLYGCSFYSALISLSLTAGVTPASVSYPGVVFLRGDNGTKVVNGFYADTINNNLFYDLVIQSVTTPVLDTAARNITLNSGSNINLNPNSAIGGQVLINGNPIGGGSIPQNLTVSSIKAVSSIISTLTVSTINGLPYGGGGGGWVSTASSALNMNGYDIEAFSLLNISTPFLYLNGHTVTAITTSNAVIDAKQNIFFNSPSNIYMSTQTVDFQQSLLRGAVYGQSLGNYKPFQFIYEPPTAAGQSAEFAIQAHPQDAGVIYNLRYGVDMAGGFGYLYCEWPGYIVVPMKISGQVVYLGEGEGVVANTNNYIDNNTKGSFTVSSLTTTIKASDTLIVGGTTTNIFANSVLNLSSGSYMDTTVLGDITTYLGGVYYVNATEAINLNSDGAIQVNTATDMLLNAPSSFTLTTNNFQVTEGGGATNIQLYNSGGTEYIDLFTGAGENEILISQASGITIKSSTITNLIANSGFRLTQTGTGGTGLLTVDASNHLYWNGTLIA